jgi:predicted component of type VI protein secretion system
MELLVSARSRESGTVSSARCSIDDALTLGRGPDSVLPLDGAGISREHFKLHPNGHALFITDLSSNGTWLNAQRLTCHEPHPLTSGDEITIPGFEIHIDWSDHGANPPPQAPKRTVPSEAPAEPPKAGRSQVFLLGIAASLSGVEKLLIVLGLATIAVVVLYVASI